MLLRSEWMLLLLSILVVIPSSTSSCPCLDSRWCATIEGPPVRPSGEVYGFMGLGPHDLGQDMNWTHVTTVAWANKDEVMCVAHQHGARAVMASPPIHNMTAMTDPQNRKIWVQDTLDKVLSTYRDGIVFDYEAPMVSGSIEGEAYVQLIAETRSIFQQVKPSLQITTCVAWSPNDIDGRAYPYKKLAEASDLLYVMDYDTRSQIFGDCIAGANAPLPGMIAGMEDWFNLGISKNSFVLGVPWYGYKYPCLPGTGAAAIVCPIQPVPFRGVNCSDAAGSQVAHADAIRAIQKHNATVRRDEASQSLSFNTVETSKTDGSDAVYQYWMEDPLLLRKKYRWAREQGLAGVGPYNFQDVDPIQQPEESRAMWSAFDEFLIGGVTVSDQ